MAKKVTKKVNSKSTKKDLKSKSASPKKSETSKKIQKSAGLALSAPKDKSLRIKEKAQPLTKVEKKPSKTSLAKSSDPLVELRSKEVFESPESKDEVPTKKAKKQHEGTTEEENRWMDLYDKHKNIKAPIYKMSEVYPEKTPIEHKVLGWGFVQSVVNDRLEVLFRSGIKHLISNYKNKA